jgi:hypothetical protein
MLTFSLRNSSILHFQFLYLIRFCVKITLRKLGISFIPLISKSNTRSVRKFYERFNTIVWLSCGTSLSINSSVRRFRMSFTTFILLLTLVSYSTTRIIESSRPQLVKSNISVGSYIALITTL